MKHWADGDSEQRRPVLRPRDAAALEQVYADAVRLGFLGPREEERLWERHLNDALGLAPIRRPKPEERWADLGSGAGLPGLPLAVAYRATAFTLIDAQRRRVDWVAGTVAKLGLTNVTVVHARLEDYGRGPARQSFDVATARALGPLPVVAELGLPLLKIGGQLLVPRGRPGSDELEQATCEVELVRASAGAAERGRSVEWRSCHRQAQRLEPVAGVVGDRGRAVVVQKHQHCVAEADA